MMNQILCRRSIQRSLMVLAVLVSACNDDDPPSERQRIIDEPVLSQNPPLTYQLFDDECQRAQEPVNLTKADVAAWNEFSITSASAVLEDVSTGTSLRSSIISETTYGDDFLRQCDWRQRGSGAGCPDENGREKGWTRARAQYLRICRDQFTYPRGSFEGVALTSAYYLQRANASFREHSTLKTNLPPVELLVLPTFRSRYENFVDQGVRKTLELYVTHNLAYFPASDRTGKPLMAVFPEPKKSAEATPIGSLWESSFVLAHEFGHHVEHAAIAPAFKGRKALSWNGLKHEFEDISSAGEAMAGWSTQAKLTSAVSEGFADLMAYYAGGGTSASLAGIACFGYNRSIEHERFRDGTAKILTHEIITELLSRAATPALIATHDLLECEIPKFTQVHSVGAVIAYGVDATLGKIVELTGLATPKSAEDFAVRYGAAVAWLTQLYKISERAGTQDESISSLVQPLGTALEEVASSYFLRTVGGRTAEDAAKFKTAVCETVRENLPVIARPPFANGAGGCG